jgi:hypothetical protein
MNTEDIIRMAQEAGFEELFDNSSDWVCFTDEIEKFAALIAAAERNKLAAWMIQRSYATGHGDTIEDLLAELEWQVRESEREACARECWEFYSVEGIAQKCNAAIRARGEQK